MIQGCLYKVSKSLSSPHCLWPLLAKEAERKACVMKHAGAENANKVGVCKGLSRNYSRVCERRDAQASGHLVTHPHVLENMQVCCCNMKHFQTQRGQYKATLERKLYLLLQWALSFFLTAQYLYLFPMFGEFSHLMSSGGKQSQSSTPEGENARCLLSQVTATGLRFCRGTHPDSEK